MIIILRLLQRRRKIQRFKNLDEDYMSEEKLFIPLYNFECKYRKTLILKNAKLHRTKDITQSTILHHKRTDSVTNVKASYEIILPKYIMEIDNIFSYQTHTLDMVLAIFKLFKENPDPVTSYYILKMEPNTELKVKYFYPYYEYWINLSREMIKYTLFESDKKHFIKFWNEFINIKLFHPIYRFLLADFNPYLYNQFFEYVLALEYLFVPEDSPEISYKFKTRGALILEPKDSIKREQVLNDLNDIYTLRSKIAHSAKPNKSLKGKEWEDWITKVRDYTRRAIIFFHQKKLLNEREKNNNSLDPFLKNKLLLEPEIKFDDVV
jgi:hypothetical protein